MPRSALIVTLLISLPMPLAAQTPSKAAREGTAGISGRVVLKGEAVRDVALTLLPQGGMGAPNPASTPRTKSDGDGRFRFTGVVAGRYWLQALAPGYIGAGDQRFGPRGKSLHIVEGENLENIEVEIKRGGVIAGRVTGRNGRPLIEEQITLHQPDPNGRLNQYYDSGGNYEMYRTDDHGEYRIFGLPEGRYLVSVGVASGQGLIETSGSRYVYPRTFHPDVSEASQAKAIEVTEGSEATGVDIVVGESKRTYDILGRVLYADTGQPVAGLEISYGVMVPGRESFSAIRPNAERSNVNGEFRIRGVPPGRYGVFVRPAPDSDFYSEPAVCEIGEGDVRGIEVRVRAGTTISGVVVIEGTTDPAALSKLSQVQLSYFIRESGAPSSRGSGGVRVNSDGGFRIRGVQPGKIFITYNPYPNLRAYNLSRIEQNGVPQPDGIEVKDGTPVTGIRAVLTYSALTLRGEVKIAGGSLPPNQLLYVRMQPMDRSNRSSTNADADLRGRFLIEYLSPGEYELIVSPGVAPNSNRPDPNLMRAFATARQRIVLRDANHPPVVITVDLSQKEER